MTTQLTFLDKNENEVAFYEMGEYSGLRARYKYNVAQFNSHNDEVTLFYPDVLFATYNDSEVFRDLHFNINSALLQIKNMRFPKSKAKVLGVLDELSRQLQTWSKKLKDVEQKDNTPSKEILKQMLAFNFVNGEIDSSDLMLAQYKLKVFSDDGDIEECECMTYLPKGEVICSKQ